MLFRHRRHRKKLENRELRHTERNQRVLPLACSQVTPQPRFRRESQELWGGCYMRAGPPALFAFPLPLLTHTSWQTEFGRWFKFGLRKYKCAFNRCPISRNHPIFYFPRLLLHKSAQTLLSAVIRCRRHSSHLARIRKAGVAASNRIAQDNRILEVAPCKNRRPSGLLPSGPSPAPNGRFAATL